MKSILKSTAVAGIGLSLLMVAATAAQANTFNFYKLTNTNAENLGNQLTMDVSAVGSTQVAFTFYQTPLTYAGSITDIYFDAGTPANLAAPVAVSQTSGVKFSVGANPGNLPSGVNASPTPFVTTVGLSADSDPGNPGVLENGVNALNESVTLTMSLANSMGFGDLIALITSGVLRVGLHVQGIGVAGDSDSYINNDFGKNPFPPPPEVPLPLPGLLLLTGLAGLGFMGRMKRSTARLFS